MKLLGLGHHIPMGKRPWIGTEMPLFLKKYGFYEAAGPALGSRSCSMNPCCSSGLFPTPQGLFLILPFPLSTIQTFLENPRNLQSSGQGRSLAGYGTGSRQEGGRAGNSGWEPQNHPSFHQNPSVLKELPPSFQAPFPSDPFSQ